MMIGDGGDESPGVIVFWGRELEGYHITGLTAVKVDVQYPEGCTIYVILLLKFPEFHVRSCLRVVLQLAHHIPGPFQVSGRSCWYLMHTVQLNHMSLRCILRLPGYHHC